ncbi:methyltransferase [Tothia fuscella]|uniref:Methyltransferase n=1 Tax=Tothia fuscella TaxID=1048955 RepID=A0A9P4P0T0_9PEZI|nr:methyltransferase [Tothia fuscella]
MEIPLNHDHTGKRKQLSNGMAHLQPYVTVPTTIPSTSTTYGVPDSVLEPIRKPRTDSSANPEKRLDPFQFGSRFLEEGDDIFSHNAWDHVETDEAYKEFADGQFAAQRENPVSDFDKKRFNEAPEKWWNKFYANNTSNFFKNRKWLHQEFPILTALTQTDSPPTLILETGAGAGNTAYPILALNKNPLLKIHACDFSKKAVDVIKNNDAYRSEDSIGEIHSSVWDVASPPNPDTNEPTLPEGIMPGTVDVVIMIFIFSALEPRQWDQCVRNIWHALKPGGVVLFRDYGRGDLAQVRFKKGRWMGENFYVRGDGTRVYFFEEEELRQIWSGESEGQPSESNEAPNLANKIESLSIPDDAASRDDTTDAIPPHSVSRPKFEVVNLGVDRRMLVNRQRRLKMYRCWMQAKFRKPAFSNGEAQNDLPSSSTPSAVEVMATEVAAEHLKAVEITYDQSSSVAQHPAPDET